MKTTNVDIILFQGILERKQAEVAQVLQRRDAISIEKSPDQIDQVQYLSERDVEIRNVDREFALLRQVRAALRRVHDGGFGVCVDCNSEISSKRLAAVPWAQRCIRCQDAADADRQERPDVSELVASAV